MFLGNGIETFAATDARFINEVLTASGSSQWFVSATTSSFELSFSFAPYQGDLSIPGANLTLANFASGGGSMDICCDPSGGYQIPFRITSLVGHVVPEPSIRAAMGCVLAGFGLVRFRPRRV
jgi:hypothetical protein